ncbi:MAG: hypothetical protein ACP5IL_11115 [Syntrophobacteraceae bacterium]
MPLRELFYPEHPQEFTFIEGIVFSHAHFVQKIFLKTDFAKMDTLAMGGPVDVARMTVRHNQPLLLEIKGDKHTTKSL